MGGYVMQHISAFFPPELVAWDRQRRENGTPPTRTPDIAAMNARLDRAQEEHDNAYRLWLFSKTPQGFAEWLAERNNAKPI
jgi:hypothetical protein